MHTNAEPAEMRRFLPHTANVTRSTSWWGGGTGESGSSGQPLGGLLRRVYQESGAHGVDATVDVHDLAGRAREPVRPQRDAPARGRLEVGDVPGERSTRRPDSFELLEARDRLRRCRLQRTGRHQVDADLL